jgi:acyl-CoA thioester hydrolase
MNFPFNLEEFKCVTRLKVRFSDLDAMGHVNNATYLSYLEEARIEYFGCAIGFPESSLDFGAVVARIDISYLRPIELGDNVNIFSKMYEMGEKSFDLRHVIQAERNGEIFVAAQASTKLVAYEYKNKKSLQIPENTRTKIENFEKGK